MAVVSMKQLLEAGVHFRSSDPPLEPQNGSLHLHGAQRNLHHRPGQDREEAGRGLQLCPGSVRQWRLCAGSWAPRSRPQDAIKEEAARCGGYYVNARWLGGMLTNFRTMRTRIDRLAQLRKMEEDGTFAMLPKKEVIKHQGGDREAGEVPGRCEGNEEAARCSVHR